MQTTPCPWASAPLAVLVIFACSGSVEAVPKSIQAPTGQSGSTAVHQENAAKAAETAEQAAAVAKNAAVHSHFVAVQASHALRFTEDALQKAGAKRADIEAVSRAAEEIEHEAGLESGYGRSTGKSTGDPTEIRHLEYELERIEKEYDGENQKANGLDIKISHDVHDGFEIGKEGLERIAKGQGSGIEPSLEIDTEVVPYPNAAEPFGREKTAKQLTEASVAESDGMIDQIERAQAMEGKRAVYRSLTKLRGATIASYDGIAKGHLANVENYAASHKWRQEHVIHHLAEEEADVSTWAFPNKGSKAPAPAPAPATL